MKRATKATSILNRKPSEQVHDFLADCHRHRSFDMDKAYQACLGEVAYQDQNRSQHTFTEEGGLYKQEWYESLAVGEPAFWIYDADYYICNIWACWQIYSRKYLREIQKKRALSGRSIVQDTSATRGVLDLGCGVGYTTAALTQIYPDANVWGTQLRSSFQFDVATDLGKQYGFRVTDDVMNVTDGIDLIFASEFFEHIERPFEHLEQILRRFSPRYLLIANAFNTYAIGHFETYFYRDKVVPQADAQRVFNALLQRKGYKKVKHKIWNNRPNYWKRRIT